MPRYQVIQAEVEAFALDDGRMVIIAADDSTRILPAAEFALLFTLAAERREAPERRAPKRVTKPAVKTDRRVVARKTGKVITTAELVEKEAATASSALNPKRLRAAVMWADGFKVAAIEKELGVVSSLVYYWRKVDKWPEREKVAAGAGKKRAEPVGGESWMP